MTDHLRFATVGLAIACIFMANGAVHADQFPSRPITLVVPYAPGGSTDNTARRLATSLGQALSVPVIVENKPGAATTIAASFVAKAPKDGYTILMAPGTTTSANPYLYKKLSYKFEDFAPISVVSKQPFVLTTGNGFPAKTIPELIKYAKSKEDALSYASTGNGSLTHIAGELIAKTLGIKLLQVPYKGVSAGTVDVIAGRTDLLIEGINTAIPTNAGGRGRALVVMSEERSPLLPNVPTFKEAGYPELVINTYFGLLAPAGTPEPVIKRLYQATVKAVTNPEFQKTLASGGETAMVSDSPEHFGVHLRREYEKWGPIIKPLNVTLD